MDHSLLQCAKSSKPGCFLRGPGSSGRRLGRFRPQPRCQCERPAAGHVAGSRHVTPGGERPPARRSGSRSRFVAGRARGSAQGRESTSRPGPDLRLFGEPEREGRFPGWRRTARFLPPGPVRAAGARNACSRAPPCPESTCGSAGHPGQAG